MQLGFDCSILKEVIQFYAVVFREFVPFSPHPPAFRRNCSDAPIMLAMGSVDQKKFAGAIRV